MKRFIESLLNLIYKKRCYFCNSSKENTKMCSSCYEELEFNPPNANRIIFGVDIYCAGIYTKNLQKLIRGVKYHKQKELAYYQAKFMYEYFSNLEQFKNKEFILIPVPLHKNRQKKRSYNHMELVCEEFAKISGFECNFNLIKRIKDTKPQYKLTRQQRLINLSNAFEISQNEELFEKNLLILDDICTTGSTFEEMIKELKKYGYNNITCLATSSPL